MRQDLFFRALVVTLRASERDLLSAALLDGGKEFAGALDGGDEGGAGGYVDYFGGSGVRVGNRRAENRPFLDASIYMVMLR